MSKMRFIGLDVHADTIAVSVAEPDGEVRPLGIMPTLGIGSESGGKAGAGESVEGLL